MGVGRGGVEENSLKTAAPAKTRGAAMNRQRDIRVNCNGPLQRECH